MKTLITFVFLGFAHILIAQPGPASILPSSFINDAEERTVTMKNGEMKNTPVISNWQLHASGFQPTISLATGGFFFESAESALLSVVTLNAGNIPSASMMAPVDLPHNSEIQSFKVCYRDQSNLTNFPDCAIKFTFLRIPDDGCPPETLGSIVSTNFGVAANQCPIRCLSITPNPNANLTVNNKDYFYYVTATSIDENGAGGGLNNCGNWDGAELAIRGVQVEYRQK
jgi:hypothetical protein